MIRVVMKVVNTGRNEHIGRRAAVGWRIGMIYLMISCLRQGRERVLILAAGVEVEGGGRGIEMYSM